jgi:DHA1 family chloramphenicol resistance protein-like MFS transporter
MPILLYLLAVAVFAQGTSEFLLAGLLPGISSDLGVSIPQAGLLTSAFAIGMVVGAPVMAALGRNLPPRWTLTGFLALFIAMHALGAATDDFTLLLATRVVAALANAGFLAVTLSTVTAVVAPERRTRALAVVLGGTTAALIVGVPAGALVGSLWSWRTALFAIAVISLPALVAVLVATPTRLTRIDHSRALGTLRSELRTLLGTSLQVTMLLAVLVNAATFCTFTYLAPIVTDRAGLDERLVPVVLALFGIGAFAGVTMTGRLADRYWRQILTFGGIALLAGWCLLGITATLPVALFGFVLLQGGLSFGVGSTLIGRIMATAQDAPTMGGSYATVALNLGAIIGPILGGIAFGAFAATGPVFVSGGLIAIVLLVWAWQAKILQHADSSPRS